LRREINDFHFQFFVVLVHCFSDLSLFLLFY